MAEKSDQAIETIGQLIGGLTGMMQRGRLPAVDFADIQTMFSRNEDGTPKIWYVGQATATGETRGPDAALSAAADLRRQADSD